MLRLEDDWVWDFWTADDGERHHLFFLRAPRALGDPEARHFSVRVGHAVSDDLVSWELLPDALAPRPEPAFDDGTTWTGSVLRGDDGVWRMFYTGARRCEGFLVQRVGVARSEDLLTWTREGSDALVEADPRWYETLDPARDDDGVHDRAWGDQAWRDPWVLRDPGGDGWHMLLTARAATGPVDGRGVVGHVWSPDLERWEVRPPLSEPGSGFGQLEVPQVEVVGGRAVLLFSCLRRHASDAARADPAMTGGVWLVEAPSPTGPFDVASARLLVDERRYSGRLVRRRDGSWVLLTFENVGPDGAFVGVVGDPVPFG